MLSQPFYFSLMRKYVALFGSLFDDIKVIRTDENGNPTQIIRVPITYSPKEKMMSRVAMDPTLNRTSATLPLPVIGFELMGMNYDPQRKQASTNRITHKASTSDARNYQYVPVPYDIAFELNIMVKNTEDGAKIVEQILPFFTPSLSVSAELIPEMGETKDIIVVLNRMQQEDTYTGKFEQRQMLIWTLSFTVKGYFYGPVTSAPVIKYANTVFYTPANEYLKDAVGVADPVAMVQVQPGLTANGQPTANSAESIPVSQIEADDDYGFVITIVEPRT